MRSFKVRLTPDAERDLLRPYDFMLDRDIDAAERALDAIEAAFDLLKRTPFSCRKASRNTPLLRELIIPFGDSGYVALFEIEDARTVMVLAVRHQREDDYAG